jgi:hypothetical protein
MSENTTVPTASEASAAPVAQKTRKPSAKPSVTSGGKGDTLPAFKQPLKRNSIRVERDLTRGEAEADSLLGDLIALGGRFASASPEALTALYQHLGRLTDKFGRSQVYPTIGCMLAVHERKVSFPQRVQLAATANNAVLEGNKPAFQVKAKAGVSDGTLSYRQNLPAQLTLDAV